MAYFLVNILAQSNEKLCMVFAVASGNLESYINSAGLLAAIALVMFCYRLYRKEVIEMQKEELLESFLKDQVR
jgi:hypothetical protein